MKEEPRSKSPIENQVHALQTADLLRDEIMYQQLARKAVRDILSGNRAIPIQDAPHLPPAGQRLSPDDTAVARSKS